MIRTYKGYQIKPHATMPRLYIVVTEGRGGKVPDCLTGAYTSPTLAIFDIEEYVKLKKEA